MTKSRLTGIAVQKIRPPVSGRSHFQDEIVPSLWLRVTPKANKSWNNPSRPLAYHIVKTKGVEHYKGIDVNQGALGM
jgi:hypothetical protein